MSEEAAPTDESMIGPRIVISVCMILAACVVFLPFTKRCQTSKDEPKNSCKSISFSLSACFAAGMIISISLLHILPEASEKFEGILEKRQKEYEAREVAEAKDHGETAPDHHKHDEHLKLGGHEFPLPYLLFQVGFFFMLTINTVFKKNEARDVR